MTRVAMTDVWDEARAFVTREAALLVPLAFATLGVAFLLFGMVVPEPKANTIPVGPWLFAVVPCLLLVLFGNLAISALVLVPRATVGEACRAAFARLWRAILAMLLVAVGLVAMSFAVSVISVLGIMAGQAMLAQSLAVGLLLVGWAWLNLRLLPLIPLIAIGNPRGSPVMVVREAFLLTRGRTGRIAAVLLVALIAALIVSSAIGFAFGSLLLLVGRLAGNPALGDVLVAVLSAAVTSVLTAGWTVFVAVLTRRLMAARDA